MLLHRSLQGLPPFRLLLEPPVYIPSLKDEIQLALGCGWCVTAVEAVEGVAAPIQCS